MDFTRIRSKGELTGTAQYETRGFPLTCANRVWSAWSLPVISPPYFGERINTYDNVNPSYHSLRARKAWIPPNQFRSNKTVISSSGDSFISWNDISGWACTSPNIHSETQVRGQVLALLCATYKWDTGTKDPMEPYAQQSLIGQVTTACLAKRGEGAANYVETLAELDKSWAMVSGPLTKMYDYLVYFRGRPSYRRMEKLRKRNVKSKRLMTNGQYIDAAKAKTRKGKEYLNLVASEYLAFRYGWSPLVSDVQAGFKALSETYDIAPKLYTARSTGRLFRQGIESGETTAGFVYDLRRATTHEFSVHAQYTEEYRATPFDKLGLTFKNVVGVAWELTPYSFVGDWFVNIGDLIYANIPRVGVTSKGGTYFTRDIVTVVVACNGIRHPSPATILLLSGSIGEVVTRQTSSKRRYTEFPAPSLVIKSDFRLDNYTRAADAVALITQQLGKIRF